MRKVLILLLFSVSSLWAQNFKVEETIIAGKKYWVYPFKLASAMESPRYSYSYKYSEINGLSIPPVFDSLPDGDYVMLRSKGVFKYKKIDKENYEVACFFEIHGGKISGKVKHLRYGNSLIEGTLKDNAKEGEWNFSQWDKKQKVYHNKIETYLYDILKGPYLQYDLSLKGDTFFIEKGIYGDRSSKIIYRDNAVLSDLHYINDSVSEYKSYYPNGALKCHKIQKGEIFTQSTNLQFRHIEVFDSILVKAKGKWTMVFNKALSNEDYDTYPYGSVTLYHANGQLLGEIYDHTGEDLHAGYEGVLLHGDLFYSSGKIACKKIDLPKLDSFSYFSWKYYDLEGNLAEEEFYFGKNDSYRQLHKRIIYDEKGNVVQKEVVTNSALLDWKKIMLMEAYEDEIEKFETYCLPYTYNRNSTAVQTINKYYNKKSGLRVDFEVLSADSLYHIVRTVTQGKVKVVQHLSPFDDHIPKVDMSMMVSCSHKFFKGPFDSLFIYYNDRPFTGKIKSIELNGKGLLFASKHFILIDNYELYWTDFEREKIKVDSGLIVRVDETWVDFETFEVDYDRSSFKNNKLHGPYYEKTYSLFGPKMSHEVENYKEGMRDGKFSSSERDKNIFGKYFIENEAEYLDGNIVNTEKHFNKKGKVVHEIPYSINGLRSGIEKKYNDKGEIIQSTEWLNGKRNGPHFILNELGDTLLFETYRNGELEGYFLCRILDPKNNDNGYLIRTFYDQNKYVDHFEVTDLKGVPRISIKIMESFIDPKQAVFYGLNDWNNLYLRGDVKLFYPDGKLFAEGAVNYRKKVDQWNYYSPEGRLREKVIYHDTIMLYKNIDTIRVEGTYKCFYNNGSVQYEGWFYEETEEEDCEDDLSKPKFYCFYTTYINSRGDTLLKNGTGKLELYAKNGILISEGEMVNGDNNGWWKSYNDLGKLIKVGKYENGVKEGRWLSGDLTGINYLDDRCFENAEEKAIQQEANQYYINIEEEIYKSGVRVSHRNYSFTRSK